MARLMPRVIPKSSALTMSLRTGQCSKQEKGPPRRPCVVRVSRALTSLEQANQFDVNRDGDVFADHRVRATDTEVGALDLRGRRRSNVRVAARVGRWRARTVNVKRDFFGCSVDREVADDLQLAFPGSLHGFRLEGDRRILGSVEVVRAAQIVVAHFHASIDGCRLDGGFHGGLCRGWKGSYSTEPLTFVKAPRTVEMPMWRTENWAAVWLGSIFQDCTCAEAETASTSAATRNIVRRLEVITVSLKL